MTSRRFQQTLIVGDRTNRDGNSPAFSSESMDDIDNGTSSSNSRRLRYSRAALAAMCGDSDRAQVRQNLPKILFAASENPIMRYGSPCAALSVCRIVFLGSKSRFKNTMCSKSGPTTFHRPIRDRRELGFQILESGRLNSWIKAANVSAAGASSPITSLQANIM